ncbi:hypothetical protein [Streptomyces sp. JJ38]|uniref:hypothetical protein n=1 Tax=Streptomyces sp. JJ38 TaxID=2738128 RepID=UPI00214C16D4|nr:hypothetical protein [Streptomyces sp. JJ38]
MVALFTLAACGGGGDDDEANPSAPKKSSASSSASTDAGDDEVDTSKVIGELKGANGIEIAVHSAVRDAGGFVTVSGTLYNKGDRTFRAAEWRSEETAIKSKSSIAGATLIDKSGKKRYMVLRDTDGQCLCTTGLAGVQPGESRPVFAQFPAPPANVAAVEFHVPSMSPVTLELTEG